MKVRMKLRGLRHSRDAPHAAHLLLPVVLCQLHERLSSDLLLHALDRRGEVGVLHVEILDEEVGAGQTRCLFRDDDALCFEAVAEFIELLALLVPGFYEGAMNGGS
jgi:hypothetical protein